MRYIQYSINYIIDSCTLTAASFVFLSINRTAVEYSVAYTVTIVEYSVGHTVMYPCRACEEQNTLWKYLQSVFL